MGEARENDEGGDAANEIPPSLVREYPSEHLAPALQMRAFCYDGCGNGIVATDSYTEDDTEAKDPYHLELGGGDTVGKGNDKNEAHGADDEFVPIYESPAVYVSKITESELADDVTDVCGTVD